jgi:hypothetical protein
MLGMGDHRKCCWGWVESMRVGVNSFGAGEGVTGALNNSQEVLKLV